MTLNSAYIEPFIRGEKSGGKCPGEMSGYHCCGKHCELLLNRFLIKDLHHILNLLRHLPLSSIIDDKIRHPTSFSTPCWKKIDSPTSSLDRPPTKNLDPHIHFDNSITAAH